MNNKVLVILDTDQYHVARMAETLKDRKDLTFEVYSFTDTDKFISFARENEIECLLINELLYNDVVREINIPHVFILNESGVENG